MECEYDSKMHRGLKNNDINWKDVMWHKYEMRCKKCNKLFGIYNQRFETYEFYDDIYNPGVDSEIHAIDTSGLNYGKNKH